MKKKEAIFLAAGVAILLIILPIYFLNSSRSKVQKTRDIVTSQPVSKGPYSKISLSNVYVSNGNVFVVGDTDLPNGSILIVSFDVTGRSPQDLFIGTDAKAIVTNSKFSTFMVVPKREEFNKGPYEISVSFTPRGQSDEILKLVGVEGENLAGNLVESSPNRSFRTMNLTEIKDLQM